MKEKFLTMQQFAKEMNVSYGHVQKLCQTGQLNHVKLGAVVRIPIAELEKRGGYTKNTVELIEKKSTTITLKIGEEYSEKFKKLAQGYGLTQIELMKQIIDQELTVEKTLSESNRIFEQGKEILSLGEELQNKEIILDYILEDFESVKKTFYEAHSKIVEMSRQIENKYNVE